MSKAVFIPPWFHLQRSGLTQIFFFAAFILLAVAVAVLALINQFSLLIAIFFLLIFLTTYLISPISGILLVMVLCTMTGFLDRVSLYLAGEPAPMDFIRASIEIAVLIITIQAFLRRKSAIRNMVTRKIDYLVWAYLIFSTLQTLNIFSSNLVVTIWGWRWECIPLLMYFVGRNLGNSTITVNRYFKMLISLTVILAAYAVYQAAVGLPGFERLWLSQLPLADQMDMIAEGSFFISGKVRIPSMTVGHSYYTFLAGYLFLWVFFAPRASLNRTYQFLKLLGLSLTGLYLLASLERSAVGIIAIGIAVFVWLRLRRKIGILSLVLVGLLFVGLLIVNSLLHTRTTSSVTERRLLELTNPFRAATVNWRAATVWPRVLQSLTNNPLGYGMGTFQQTSVNLGRLPFGPHNNFFRIALETGIIGLGLYLFIWGRYILLLLKAYQLNINRSLVICSLASLLPILAVAIFNNPIENPLSLFLWFSTGLTVSQVAATIDQQYG
jgi:O-antigen ligase